MCFAQEHNAVTPVRLNQRPENLSLRFETGPMVVKLFCSSQLSLKFIKLINVEMPTIVVILTFISMINTTYESLKASKVYFLAF